MRILIDGQTLSTPDIHRGIGEVFLNIIHEMIKKNTDIKWFLAAYNDFDNNLIDPIQESVKIVPLGAKLIPNSESSFEYHNTITKAIEDNSIDLLWIPNALMPNIHLIHSKPSCKVILTIHDLIPLVLHDIYLDNYAKNIANEYTFRLSRMDELSDIIVSISHSTKRDLVSLLRLNSNKIETVHLGSKIPITNKDQKLVDSPKKLLYLGGFDYRKNMYNALVAYQTLLLKYEHPDLKFIVVCSCDETSKKLFYDWVDELGLLGRVELTGYVSEHKLQELYASADVFFFPSLYEGFGLPLLEAMASGTPIAASDCSSIPEVLGDAGLLFDPNNTQDMADTLNQLLTDTILAEEIARKSHQRAAEFTWERAAQQYLDLFKQVSIPPHKTTTKPYKIAYFSPVSPQKSGISIYSEELLFALSRYIPNIDLFVDEGIIPSNQYIQEHIRWYSYIDFPKHLSEKNYDTIIYNMGNNTIHEYIYKSLLRYPGIVILHDYVLHPFIQHITLYAGKENEYVEEMKYAYGNEGEYYAKKCLEGLQLPIDYFKFPLNEKIIDSNRKIIVHSDFIRNLLAKYSHIDVIPLGSDPFTYQEDFIQKSKNELDLIDVFPIIATFGFMNTNKRISIILEVFKSIIVLYPRAKFVLCGEIDKNFKREIQTLSKEYGISNNIIITGHVDDHLYFEYLSTVDIAINLRSPTMGESSKTALDSLSFSIPTIVSNIGSYTELPDNCCWKVDVDSDERELLLAYIMELVQNDRLRRKMGINAREYIEKNHKWDKVAQQYVHLIEEVINNDSE